MLSKYSIKEGRQVISKANSVLKWSGWCTHTVIPAPPSIQNKPQFLRVLLSFQQNWLKLPTLHSVSSWTGHYFSRMSTPQTPRTVKISTHLLRCLDTTAMNPNLCAYVGLYTLKYILVPITALQELLRGQADTSLYLDLF